MSFWHDLRHGARLLRKAPLFTLGSIVVLALGIGSATAMFSLVDAALLRPLPFPESGRLVMLWERFPQGTHSRVAGLDFVDWREQNRSFAGIAATIGRAFPTPFRATDVDVADTVSLQRVSPGFFEVLGVQPIRGRTFTADDVPAGADLRPGVVSEVAVVSERLWRTRFGSDPALIGRTLTLGSAGQPARVVGIMPAGFQILGVAEVWTPTPDLRLAMRRLHFLQVIARLNPGVTLDQARSDMSTIADRLAREAPETNKGVGVTIEPLHQAIVGDDLRTTTLMLGGVVMFVLLLACANIANLILARGVGRAREIAVRAAIGGSRIRIIRQLVTESLLLGIGGGAIGLALAWAMLRAAPAIIPERTIPESVVLRLDGRLSLFAVALTLLTALVVGLVPAWHAVRVPLVEAIAAGGRGSTDRAGRIRTALAAIEVAAALLLLTGAGLFVRTLLSMTEQDFGYRADDVVTMSIGRGGSMNQDVLARYFQAIEREVAGVPGVRAASLVSNAPLTGQDDVQPFTLVGDAPVAQAFRTNAHYQIITPRYFETMGITLMQGRAFTERDTATTVAVCIINEELARRYFSGRNPIGARISVPSVLVRVPVAREVVGVIRQVKTMPDETEKALEIYVPLAQSAWTSTTLAVRTNGDPATLVPSIKAAIARVDRNQSPTRVRTMEEIAAESTSRPRFRARLVATFASLAVVLAAVGIFSVLMFTVQQRAREFGIRLALGAGSGDVFRLVLGDGLRLIAAGLAIGLVASALLARSLATLLFAVKPFDPISFAVAAVGVGGIAIAACVAPALRAVRSDPASALRAE
jgi:putative ABC transport system permease protein